MEFLTILLFSLVLLLCVSAGVSIVYALAIGYVIFFLYARMKKYRPKDIFKMSFSGIKTVKNILLIFALIGMLTALWRAAGTIPVIVCMASVVIQPSIVILITFLLNCLVSFLTGTAFGTAATMGVICMTMARAMGVDPMLTGGAILSGVFFGDRCSPVSTSALLVAEVTGTDLFQNIGKMVKTAFIPFLLTSLIYLGFGVLLPYSCEETIDIWPLFSGSFRLGWIALLPALLILILSLMHVHVKWAMMASILCAFLLCAAYQNVPLSEIFILLINGYHSSDPELSAMLDGGGILSMVRTAAIICISSSYAGIFQETGLLNRLKDRITAFGRKTTPYGAVLCTSVVASMIACNQTLAIMLTNQLCDTVQPDNQERAIDLENTAVVIAPLVPWSIASAVPLASVAAPTAGILAACYLYLLPMWQLFVHLFWRKNKSASV